MMTIEISDNEKQALIGFSENISYYINEETWPEDYANEICIALFVIKNILHNKERYNTYKQAYLERLRNNLKRNLESDYLDLDEIDSSIQAFKILGEINEYYHWGNTFYKQGWDSYRKDDNQ